jgi:type II secretory ATPase GspE/PulE/Tfp pilus assembly ATPase PilB-like protein
MNSADQEARLLEEQAVSRRARILNIGYLNTSLNPQKPLFKNFITNQEMSSKSVVPVAATEHTVTFGVVNTTSRQTMEDLLKRFADYKVTFQLISDSGFRDYLALYNPPAEVAYQNIEINTAGQASEIKDVSETLEQVRADDMLAYLVEQAHYLSSSDIHIENQKDYVRIRFRIDGVLHPIAKLTKEKNHVLLSAIASAGNVSTGSNDAQQGHITEKVRMADGNEVDVNVRLETVPTINGMDVVMRLFNMEQSMYNLDRLGLSPTERKVVDEIIAKPSGLALIVGPTGSGKTTTLYSMLNTLNTEERKIITIEDPVEFQFGGITQVSVTTKTADETSFAEKLRAVLRLDPDVVMVGEIRDMDTAKTALQAALTGHLVLSTFHAGSAAAALTRLNDIIKQNPLFVSAIRLVMAQRLVRKLDDSIKQAYTPSQDELAKIQAVIDSMPANAEKPDLANLQLFKPGKSEENPYGYKDQIALREQFLMTGEIRKLLESGQIVSAEEIEETAIKSGMRTMLQDAILKVIAGQTTLEEVYRVIG